MFGAFGEFSAGASANKRRELAARLPGAPENKGADFGSLAPSLAREKFFPPTAFVPPGIIGEILA